MKRIQFLFFTSLLLLISCSEKQEVSPSIDNCQSILDARILTPEERANACIYVDVYSYRGDIYTICECCVCDKVYQVLDCNGEDIFKNSPQSIFDFQQNLQYLFSVEVP